MAKPEEKDKFEMLIDLLTAQAMQTQPLTPDMLKAILKETSEVSAQTMQKAIRPENTDHPGISAFSHPDGDLAHPKATLPFEFFYNGFPDHMFPESSTWMEWELIRQVKPGEYTVVCKDGSTMQVTVKAEVDANLNPTKLTVSFTVSRETKWIVPPKSVVLYQLVHPDNPRQRFMEAMQLHFADAFREPVQA